MSDKEKIEELERLVDNLIDGQILVMKVVLRLFKENGEEDYQ